MWKKVPPLHFSSVQHTHTHTHTIYIYIYIYISYITNTHTHTPHNSYKYEIEGVGGRHTDESSSKSVISTLTQHPRRRGRGSGGRIFFYPACISRTRGKKRDPRGDITGPE